MSRRLRVLEDGPGRDPFAGVSDEELQSRMNAILDELDGAEVLPEGYRAWPFSWQQAWLHQSIREVA